MANLDDWKPIRNLAIKTLADADLPGNWNAQVASDSTADVGTNWASGKFSLVISVPSAIVPDERNYLINPAHADFASFVSALRSRLCSIRD